MNKTEKKTNKNNFEKIIKPNNMERIENDIIKNKIVENEKNDVNISYKVINESKNNNISKVIFSKMNNIISNNNDNENKNKITNIKLMSHQLKNKKDNNPIENKTKNKTKSNLSQSMDKLNSIIEDYYKSKNFNNIIVKSNNIKEEDNINNSSINNVTGIVKVTYSSSCDNKKIRTTSSFHGPKVTVFQHFHKKHTVNNNYRESQ